jgi:hypothetical protein
LLFFAGALLTPVLIGAVVSGLVLLHSATTASRLTEEVVRETTSSITLFQDLEAARLAGSEYMEEGERDARNTSAQRLVA